RSRRIEITSEKRLSQEHRPFGSAAAGGSEMKLHKLIADRVQESCRSPVEPLDDVEEFSEYEDQALVRRNLSRPSQSDLQPLRSHQQRHGLPLQLGETSPGRLVSHQK